jgi:RNA polymerase sigma-70 factor (ECF subfamily)
MGAQGAVLKFAVAAASAADSSDLEPLVARITARDGDALATLFDLTSGRLYALASAILRNREDAEEVVCDTFTQVWNEAIRFDAGRASVLGWLTVICRSRALDRRRQRRVRGAAAELEAAADVVDTQPQPADLLSLLEEGTVVRAALAQLSEERRELISLAFLEGMSHQEIAERKQLPLGTVKSHVRRALLQLRATLETQTHS